MQRIGFLELSHIFTNQIKLPYSTGCIWSYCKTDDEITKKYSFDVLNSNYSIKENKKIYKGNICLDLGCNEGSSSFYSRSNQIIESGGLIIQSKQMDSNEKWGQLSKDIIFKDFNNLNFIINEVLNDYHNANKILTKIFNHFSNSHKHLEKNLKNYF